MLFHLVQKYAGWPEMAYGFYLMPSLLTTAVHLCQLKMAPLVMLMAKNSQGRTIVTVRPMAMALRAQEDIYRVE